MSASTSRYTGMRAWSLARARDSSRVGMHSLLISSPICARLDSPPGSCVRAGTSTISEGRALIRPAGSRPKANQRRNGVDATIFAAHDLPVALVHHPVMPITEGLLPNSRQQATIGVPSFLAHVSAGGAALDGVQSGRAEALPQLLA